MDQKEKIKIESTQIIGINFNKEKDIIHVSWVNPYIGFGTLTCSMDYDIYDSEGMGHAFEEFIINKIKEEKEKLLDEELKEVRILYRVTDKGVVKTLKILGETDVGYYAEENKNKYWAFKDGIYESREEALKKAIETKENDIKHLSSMTDSLGIKYRSLKAQLESIESQMKQYSDDKVKIQDEIKVLKKVLKDMEKEENPNA